MERGYIKIWRKIIDTPVWQHDGMLRLWLWILLTATRKEMTLPVQTGRGTTLVTLHPGEMIFGRHAAAAALGRPGATVSSWLARLEAMKYIVTQPGTHFTVVKVCNWGSYQGNGEASLSPNLAGICHPTVTNKTLDQDQNLPGVPPGRAVAPKKRTSIKSASVQIAEGAERAVESAQAEGSEKEPQGKTAKITGKKASEKAGKCSPRAIRSPSVVARASWPAPVVALAEAWSAVREEPVPEVLTWGTARKISGIVCAAYPGLSGAALHAKLPHCMVWVRDHRENGKAGWWSDKPFSKVGCGLVTVRESADMAAAKAARDAATVESHRPPTAVPIITETTVIK